MIKEKVSNKINQISLNVVQSKIDSIRKTNITKTGLRVYDNDKIGVSGAIGQYTDESLLEKAKEALKLGLEYPYEISGNNERQFAKESYFESDKDFLERMEAFLDNLDAAHKDFYFSNKINRMIKELSMVNDNGLNLLYKDSYYEIQLTFKERKSSNIIDGILNHSARVFDPDSLSAYYSDILTAFSTPIVMPSKKRYPVFFTIDEDLPVRKFLTDLDGTKFGTGSSLFSGKQEQKLFSDKFTLYQSYNSEKDIKPFFDAEGTTNIDDKFNLIENGILKTPYTDKKTSARYNLPHTGGAGAVYDGVPRCGAGKLRIEESGRKLKELLGGEPGIFVFISMGGDFTPDGNFASPVQVAFLHDGDRFIGKLPELQLKSNVFDMYGDSFRGVSSDYFVPSTGVRFLVMEMEVTKI